MNTITRKSWNLLNGLCINSKQKHLYSNYRARSCVQRTKTVLALSKHARSSQHTHINCTLKCENTCPHHHHTHTHTCMHLNINHECQRTSLPQVVHVSWRAVARGTHISNKGHSYTYEYHTHTHTYTHTHFPMSAHTPLAFTGSG